MMLRNYKTRAPRRAAMTLLELILALFIATIILAAIGMAMQLQALSIDSRRHVVEEVQLARAILRQIADDLRSAARYEELTIADSSQALSTESTDSGSAAGGSSGSGGSSTSGSGTDSSTTDQAADAANALDVENSTSATSIPGVFGNQNQLQVDVSRLPRIDEFQPLLASAPGQMASVPSGFRTIAYYVTTQTDPATGAAHKGLFRRELDRTITDYAMRSGNATSINAQGELLAEEVEAIEFRYFDGKQFLYQWDTEAQTALPIAVEINLWLRAPVSGRPTTARDSKATLYRLVVAIPTGEFPPDASSMSTTPEDSANGGGSVSSMGAVSPSSGGTSAPSGGS